MSDPAGMIQCLLGDHHQFFNHRPEGKGLMTPTRALTLTIEHSLKRRFVSALQDDQQASCEARCIHPDAVRRGQQVLDRAQDLPAVTALFGALADPTRLRLLLILRSGALCTCDLAAVLGLTESAVSHQVRTLKEAGLIASERSGKLVFHRLADHHVEQLIEMARTHAAEGKADAGDDHRAAA